MKSEQEIKDRIEHIKTLKKGYGINEKRVKELEWVLGETRYCKCGNPITGTSETLCYHCWSENK